MRPALAQIGAIARTEIRFGLRRGLLPMGPLLACGMLTALTLYVAYLRPLPPEVVAAGVRLSSLGAGWPVFTLVAPFVLPIVATLVIPDDRESRADTWLRSLPIDGWTYLAGKLGGTLTVVGAVTLAGFAIHLLLYRLFVGRIDLAADLELIALCGLPFALWLTAFSVLIGAWFRTRRAAILVGVAVGLFSQGFWGFGLPALTHGPGVDFRSYTGNLIADFILQRHQLAPAWATPVSSTDVVIAATAVLVVLLIAAVAARARLLWKENL